MAPGGIRVVFRKQSSDPDKLVFEEIRKIRVIQVTDLEGCSMHRQPSCFRMLFTQMDQIRLRHGSFEGRRSPGTVAAPPARHTEVVKYQYPLSYPTMYARPG
jgi:hypothetical protein